MLDTIVVNVSNLCNFTCSRCPYDAPERARFMDKTMFEMLAAQARAASARRVRFLGLSEPTLHPFFPEFVALLKAQGVGTHVISNGSFVMTPQRREAIALALPDELEVSLDAASSQIYERIRGKSRDYFDLLCTRLESFFIEAKGRAVCTVSFVRWPDTEDELQVFEKRWRGIVDRVRIRGAHSFSGRVDVAEGEHPSNCPFLEDRIFVDWDGTISVCNLDNEGINRLGVISERYSIGDAWGHPRREAVVSAINSRNPDAQCVSCSRCASAP